MSHVTDGCDKFIRPYEAHQRRRRSCGAGAAGGGGGMTVVIYDTGTTYEIDPSAIYDPFPEVGDGEKEKTQVKLCGY